MRARVLSPKPAATGCCLAVRYVALVSASLTGAPIQSGRASDPLLCSVQRAAPAHSGNAFREPVRSLQLAQQRAQGSSVCAPQAGAACTQLTFMESHPWMHTCTLPASTSCQCLRPGMLSPPESKSALRMFLASRPHTHRSLPVCPQCAPLLQGWYHPPGPEQGYRRSHWEVRL